MADKTGVARSGTPVAEDQRGPEVPMKFLALQIKAVFILLASTACTKNSNEENAAVEKAQLSPFPSSQVVQEFTRFKSDKKDHSDEVADGKILCLVNKGTLVSFDSEPGVDGQHVKVILKSKIKNCQMTAGYFYGPHIYGATRWSQMKKKTGEASSVKIGQARFIAEESKIKATYQNQLENYISPDGSCGITTTAMVLRFFGVSTDTNRLTSQWGIPQARSLPGIQEIIGRHGLRIAPLSDRYTIQKYIDQGFPVILQTWFTYSGHILLVVGYDNEGFFFNDPYGKWEGTSGRALGYTAYVRNSGNRINGVKIHYSYKSIENSEGGTYSYQGAAVLWASR